MRQSHHRQSCIDQAYTIDILHLHQQNYMKSIIIELLQTIFGFYM